MGHSPAEKALYLGEAHDAPDANWGDDFITETKLRALERKLKSCSHYQVVGSSSLQAYTAQAECDRMVEEKKKRRANDKRTMARCSRLIQLLKEKVGYGLDKNWRKELTAIEDTLKAQGRPGVEEHSREEFQAQQERTNQRCSVLAGYRPRDSRLARALADCAGGDAGVGSMRHWEAFSESPLGESQAVSLLASAVVEQVENLLSFCAAVASQEYFNHLIKVLVEGWRDRRSCAGCHMASVPLTKLTITPCAHSLCVECFRKCVDDKGKCCACGQPLQLRDLHALDDEVVKSATLGKQSIVIESAGRKVNDAKDDSFFDKHGTKLTVLVERLQQLRKDDPTAKAILFVQFDDMKAQVAAALRDAQIPTAQLRGSVSQRASTIRDWQENPDSKIYVLLLSLQDSASGTNLTAGSHVVFVHPMLASTSERAVAQELQAIGRARRHGQQRETLHVWRFVTNGTIEADITKHALTALAKHDSAAKAFCQERLKK